MVDFSDRFGAQQCSSACTAEIPYHDVKSTHRVVDEVAFVLSVFVYVGDAATAKGTVRTAAAAEDDFYSFPTAIISCPYLYYRVRLFRAILHRRVRRHFLIDSLLLLIPIAVVAAVAVAAKVDDCHG